MDYIPLRMGASGPQVREVQRMLLDLGYRIGHVDGKFGVRTQRGVIAFQSAHELPIDGIVATNTWMALERHVGRRPEPEEMPPEPTPRELPPPMPPAPMREIPPPPMAAPEICPLPPPPPTEPSAPPLPIMPLIDWAPTPVESVRVPESAPRSHGGWTQVGEME